MQLEFIVEHLKPHAAFLHLFTARFVTMPIDTKPLLDAKSSESLPSASRQATAESKQACGEWEAIRQSCQFCMMKMSFLILAMATGFYVVGRRGNFRGPSTQFTVVSDAVCLWKPIMMTFNVVVAGGAILHLFNTLILCPARCFLGRFLPIVALKDDATCAYNRMQPFFQIFILSMTFLMVGTSNFVFGFYEADGKWVRISMRFVDSCISPNLIAACAVGLLTCAIWLGALLLKNVFFSLKSGISNVRGWCCTKKEE